METDGTRVAAPQRVPPGTGTRRRGAALERAILRAAWDELADVGYTRLTMEGVAARAGTSKAVLYRRWRDRGALVLAAMRQERPLISAPVPDTGSLRGDALALLGQVSHGLGMIGQETLLGLLAEYFRDAESVVFRQTHELATAAMLRILRRAAERGEVRLDALPPRVVTLPVDLTRHEILITRAPVPDDVLAAIIDDIFLPLVGAYSRLNGLAL